MKYKYLPQKCNYKKNMFFRSKIAYEFGIQKRKVAKTYNLRKITQREQTDSKKFIKNHPPIRNIQEI